MSKNILVALVLAVTSSVAVAAPASIWTLEFSYPTDEKDRREYALHPPGTKSSPMTYADAKVAIDTRVQKGEWVVQAVYFGRRWKEAWDLLDRVRQRGAFVVEPSEVMEGTIVGVPLDESRENTKGYVTSLKVNIKNKSPYELRATKLMFGSCTRSNAVTLSKPVVIKAKGTQQVSITIDPKNTQVPEATLASCADRGGWSTVVFVEFTP